MWQVGKKAIANSLSVICMCTCVYVCTCREGGGEGGKKEGEETEFGNGIWKSFHEVIYIDCECIVEKIICIMVRNVVSKPKTI